jgi:hypothetical protein
MKYAVLLLALMFAGCDEGSSTVGYEIKIDGSTIQVAKEDFPNEMSWVDAMAACQNLGNGWRLPSIDELGAMYEQLHKQDKGNFKNEWYWSSSTSGRTSFGGNNDEQALCKAFSDGSIFSFDYDGGGNYTGHFIKHKIFVRPVRALP